MTAGNVMHTTVLARRIVKPDPTRDVSHRSRSGPVGIVLMPDHDAAVMRGLVEDLIVPEAHCAFEQLSGRHGETRMPKHVVQTRQDSPGAERVEEDLFRIRRLV